MTKMNEIKKMKDSELVDFVLTKREAIRGFRFGTGSRDVRAKRSSRKEVARALTELTARSRQSKAEEV